MFLCPAHTIPRGDGMRRGVRKLLRILCFALIVCLAALFVFVFKMGVAGVFVATILDELLRGGINTIRFFKIKF